MVWTAPPERHTAPLGTAGRHITWRPWRMVLFRHPLVEHVASFPKKICSWSCEQCRQTHPTGDRDHMHRISTLTWHHRAHLSSSTHGGSARKKEQVDVSVFGLLRRASILMPDATRNVDNVRRPVILVRNTGSARSDVGFEEKTIMQWQAPMGSRFQLRFQKSANRVVDASGARVVARDDGSWH